MSRPPIETAASSVVLVAGPSGSGKTSLAALTGLPVLHLDDFYKDGDDPSLPLVAGTSDVDWDSPASWNAEAALAALVALCRTGRAEVPVYSIASSARTGTAALVSGGAPVVLAEGIFAADIVARCRELGVLGDALCLRGRPSTTFRRRLLRDLREGRKPVLFLLRRGWRLMRTERAVVARQTALGAHPCAKPEALARVDAAIARAVPAPRPAADPVTASAASVSGSEPTA